MKDLPSLILSIQKLADEFDGSVSIKNASRRYFYANDFWLKTVGLKREEVIGKLDDEIVPEANASHIRKTDAEALSRQGVLQYRHTAELQGAPVEYIALKWVVRYSNGEPFCICTIATVVNKQDDILKLQERLDSIVAERLQ